MIFWYSLPQFGANHKILLLNNPNSSLKKHVIQELQKGLAVRFMEVRHILKLFESVQLLIQIRKFLFLQKLHTAMNPWILKNMGQLVEDSLKNQQLYWIIWTAIYLLKIRESESDLHPTSLQTGNCLKDSPGLGLNSSRLQGGYQITETRDLELLKTEPMLQRLIL